MNDSQFDFLPNIKTFLLDMDGTIYSGSHVFPWTVPFLECLNNKGIEYYFLTNNSSLSSSDYVKKLRSFNIPVGENGVITSGDAAIFRLKQLGYTRIYLLGTESLENDFKSNGFILTEKEPDAVVLGFDKTITYKKIVTANNHITAGVPFIATHPDLVCPYEPYPLPDTGAMIKMFEASSGVTPEIIGKPETGMYNSIAAKYGLNKMETAVAGDRLYTDILFGIRNGLKTILVLSGETTVEILNESDVIPDCIFPSLEGIIKYL